MLYAPRAMFFSDRTNFFMDDTFVPYLFVMSPHPYDLDGSDFFQDLVYEAVLDVDTT
jgi:hypothetical protein